MKTHIPRQTRFALGVLAILGATVFVGPALGQKKFKEIREYTGADGTPVKVVPPDKKTDSSVRLLLGKGTGSAEEMAKVNSYFLAQVYAMTLPEYLAQVGPTRDQMRKNLMQLGRAPSTEMHDGQLQVLFSILPQLAADPKVHPAARFNALLLLGDLNIKEPDNANRGAEPNHAVLPMLVNVISLDASGKPAQPIYLRVAAMVGILRHIRYDVAADVRGTLVNNLAATLANEGDGKQGDLWLRRRAAQALGELASKYPEISTPEIADSLVKLVANKDADVLTRCEAALALGNLDPKSLSKLNLEDAYAAIAVLTTEVAKLKPNVPAEDAKALASTGMGMGMSMYMGGKGGPPGMGPPSMMGGPPGGPKGQAGKAGPPGSGSGSGGSRPPAAGSVAPASDDQDKKKEPESTVYRDGLRYYFVSTRAALNGEDGKHGLMVVAEGSPLQTELKHLASELNEFIKSCYNSELSETELAAEVNSRGETLVKQLIAGQPSTAPKKGAKANADDAAAPGAKAPVGKAGPASAAPAGKAPAGKAPARKAQADSGPASDDGSPAAALPAAAKGGPAK